MNDYAFKQLVLIKSIEEQFKAGKSPSTIVEPVSDYETDNRICLTTLAYLPSNLQEKIYQEIVGPLRKLDFRQYFYEKSALHITVQNVRVINNPPHFTKEDIEKAREVFLKVTENTHRQKLKFNAFLSFQRVLLFLPLHLCLGKI